MPARALDAGLPVAWVTGDSVYGHSGDLRQWLEARDRSYVRGRGRQRARVGRVSAGAGRGPVGGPASTTGSAGCWPSRRMRTGAATCSSGGPGLAGLEAAARLDGPVLPLPQALTNRRFTTVILIPDRSRVVASWLRGARNPHLLVLFLCDGPGSSWPPPPGVPGLHLFSAQGSLLTHCTGCAKRVRRGYVAGIDRGPDLRQTVGDAVQ